MILSATALASVTAAEHTGSLTTTNATVTSVSSDSVVVFDNGAELERLGYYVENRAELVCFDIEPSTCALSTRDLVDMKQELKSSWIRYDDHHSGMRAQIDTLVLTENISSESK